jgi:hypothetical protein
MTSAVGVFAQAARAFWPAAARKKPSFSFDVSASPQHQTKFSDFSAQAGIASGRAEINIYYVHSGGFATRMNIIDVD